jgi:fido (protein-threonine AMPylation protein)
VALQPPKSIEAIEAALVANRIAEIIERPIAGNYDAAHLREFHRFIFQDLPKYAPGEYRPDAPSHGKERRLESEPINPHRVEYALRPEVDDRLDTVLRGLRSGDALRGLSTPDFVSTISKLYGDLDHLHPFSEGNSRTLRSFTRQLAEQTGHELDWNITNANAVTRDALYKARDIEVLRRTYPAIDAVSASQQEGDRLMLKAAETLRRFANADRLDELIRQSAEQSLATVVGTQTVPIDDAEAEIAALLPAARRQAAATEETTRVASLRNRSLVPAHSQALARKSMLDGERAPDRLLGILRDQGQGSVTFDRAPGEAALNRVLAYRDGLERQLANQLKDTPNGTTQDVSSTPLPNSPPHPERLAVHSRDAGRSSTSRPEPAIADGRGMQGLLSLGRGSTLARLADKVPAGRTIPDGAEQVVVMNGSRLHERRYEGKWEVQKSDPQGMLPKGVFRLDTAAPAKADDGATYAGSILHVSARGVYQVHGNGVARHEPAAFQQVPTVGDSPKIVYANGRATITGRDPQSQGQGRSR